MPRSSSSIGVEAGGDDAAVAQQHGRFARPAPRPALRRSRRADSARRASMSSSDASPAGSCARSAGSAASVARRPASSRGRTWRSAIARGDALDVADAAQRLAQRLEAGGVQRVDRVVALRRRRGARAAGASATGAAAAAHAGAAGVEQRQQGRRVLAAQRLRQFEVALRRRRQVEQVAGALRPRACARARAPGPACARRSSAAPRRRRARRAAPAR